MPRQKSEASVIFTNYGAYKEIETVHGDNDLAAQRNCNEARKHARDSVIVRKWRSRKKEKKKKRTGSNLDKLVANGKVLKIWSVKISG